MSKYKSIFTGSVRPRAAGVPTAAYASLWCAAVSLMVGCGASAGSNGAKDIAQPSAGGAPGGTNAASGASAGGAQGGTNATSGAGAGAGAAGGKGGGGDTKPPPHVVVPCGAAEVGKWEEITPPEVLNSARYSGKQGYGVNAMVIDPTNTANITLGTDQEGVHRTTDCGATWTHVNVGQNGAALDAGTQWTMSIDPAAPDTIYTVSGYGTGGVFKTTDAGKNWVQALAAEYAKNFILDGFTAQVRVDPTQHEHVIITPHFSCQNGHSTTCFLETVNGGTTWDVVEDAPSGGEGARLLVVDRDTWFSGVGFGGLYRTGDAGKTWTHLTDGQSYAFEVYHRPGGKFYVPTAFGVSQSDDGIAWAPLANSPGAHVVTTSDKRIYASTGGFCVSRHDTPFNAITSAPIDDPTNWTVDTSFSNYYGSGELHYDVDHHILYTSNCLGGLWRVRTE